MVWRRVVAGALALLFALLAAALYMSVAFRGMPDGDIRDVQRATMPIDGALGWFALGMALAALWIAIRVPWELTRGTWLAAVALFLLAGAGAWVYEDYLRGFLDYGQGG